MPESTDPLDVLRSGIEPTAPRPAFATELRALLEASLSPLTPTTQRATSAHDVSAVLEQTMASTPTLSPYLMVADAAAAIDFYREAFGAIETMRFVGDDGRIGHAEMTIGSARIMLADEYPEMDLIGPIARGGTSVSLHLEVDHVDFLYAQAIEAGATSVREPSDQGHGNRNATVTDPFGHRWMLSQPIDAERTALAQADGGVGGDGREWTVTTRLPVEPGYLTLETGDLPQATAFFGSLFDWVVHDGAQPGGGHVGNTRFPLGFITVDAEHQSDRGTMVYFRVDELDAYTARVGSLGGRVLERSSSRAGEMIECTDDQGFRFHLWVPASGY
jgi:uncharacterized glyoxalase superfamily protein PhnB